MLPLMDSWNYFSGILIVVADKNKEKIDVAIDCEWWLPGFSLLYLAMYVTKEEAGLMFALTADCSYFFFSFYCIKN
jgi:hypothetical protein